MSEPALAPSERPNPSTRELAFAVAIALLLPLALDLLVQVTPALAPHASFFISLLMLALPVYLLGRRKRPLDDAGVPERFDGKTLTPALFFCLALLPLFALGFGYFHNWSCDTQQPWSVPNICRRLAPPSALFESLRFPPDILTLIATQFIVVALPEELFFRGYLQGALERRWPAKRKIAGGGVGIALLLSSALFALAHLQIPLAPQRLATFFPALLFGWMRSRTNSILSSIIAHAAANITMHILVATYFR